MKKFVLISICFLMMSIDMMAYVNSPLVDPTPCSKAALLPEGMYFLCCKNGDLILYNVLGQQVGWGPDCGGMLEDECFRCFICSEPICPDHPERTQDELNVIALLRTIEPQTGEQHSGELCENMTTYTFCEDEINE